MKKRRGKNIVNHTCISINVLDTTISPVDQSQSLAGIGSPRSLGSLQVSVQAPTRKYQYRYKHRLQTSVAIVHPTPSFHSKDLT